MAELDDVIERLKTEMQSIAEIAHSAKVDALAAVALVRSVKAEADAIMEWIHQLKDNLNPPP